MKKIAIIGGGISGLSAAKLLREKFDVTVFENASRPGGLVKCKRVDGNLYHMVGGHVFNSRRQDVMDLFWSFFDKESEFVQAERNATIFLNSPVGYPIENHLYELGSDIVQRVISDLLKLEQRGSSTPANFEEFLRGRFGETLYSLYFKPYNEKIWKRDLSGVPLSWLAGKLPMPTVEEILYNNIKKEKEVNMVHSSFYYPKVNGSQFLVDRLSEGLEIVCDACIESLAYDERAGKWTVNNLSQFDSIVYAGNIKNLPGIVDVSLGLSPFERQIEQLEYHGTTSVLCEVESNPYSWVYLPDPDVAAHRIINTGNFAESNNWDGIKTATVEFTDYVAEQDILDNLARMPFRPKYLSHEYTEYTYPIQADDTRALIDTIKERVESKGMYILGRFAEWEYYNMDAAMGAAIDLSKRVLAL